MSAFGDELRRQREYAEISMTKLGKRAGYDHSHISRLESGNAASLDCLIRLARAITDDPVGQIDAFTGLLYAWIADHGIRVSIPQTITHLGLLLPQMPEGERRDVKRALRELRDYAQEIVDQKRSIR